MYCGWMFQHVTTNMRCIFGGVSNLHYYLLCLSKTTAFKYFHVCVCVYVAHQNYTQPEENNRIIILKTLFSMYHTTSNACYVLHHCVAFASWFWASKKNSLIRFFFVPLICINCFDFSVCILLIISYQLWLKISYQMHFHQLIYSLDYLLCG